MKSLPLLLGTMLMLTSSCSKHTKSNHPPMGDMSVHPADFSSVTPMFDLACAGTSAKASLKPVTLLFLLDASASMADTFGAPPVAKYDSVVSGLQAFFADPQSAGLSAAMAIFPYPANHAEQCDRDSYDPGAPNVLDVVPLTALPAPSPFDQAMALASPVPGGGAMTPTEAAVLGMTDYGVALLGQNANSRIAMVLVTDGVPDVCGSANTTQMALMTASSTDNLPTYVIGVGDETGDLDQLATGGGTVSPIPVTVGDPLQTKADILTALEGIRGLVLSCDFPVPAPPNGQKINYQQVNVTFTPSNSATEDLLYDPGCVGQFGWYYDNPTTPTKVLLCPNICNVVRQDHGGAINVVFGCGTFMQVT